MHVPDCLYRNVSAKLRKTALSEDNPSSRMDNTLFFIEVFFFCSPQHLCFVASSQWLWCDLSSKSEPTKPLPALLCFYSKCSGLGHGAAQRGLHKLKPRVCQIIITKEAHTLLAVAGPRTSPGPGLSGCYHDHA